MSTAVTIRPPLGLRIYVVAFGVLWCGFLLVAVVATLNPLPLLMVAFGATICYRNFNLAAIADGSGLLIRNNFRTKQLPWADVEGFRIGSPTMGLPIGKVIYVLLNNGEVLTLDVTMRPWLGKAGRSRLQGYLTDLMTWIPPGA